MAAQEADPLSFFAGDASSSSESEDEEEKGSGIVPLNDKSYYTSSDQVCSVCVNTVAWVVMFIRWLVITIVIRDHIEWWPWFHTEEGWEVSGEGMVSHMLALKGLCIVGQFQWRRCQVVLPD